MKEYKYKINGNSYKVTIGDIEDNIAHVEVNGTHYKVEMEKQPKPVAKPVTVRPMPNAPAAPTQVVKPTAPSTGKSGVKSPLLTLMAVILPSLSALILFSIFMASNMIMVCPFFTVSPTFTLMSRITPGSGDFTPDFPVDGAVGFTT